MSYLKQSSLIYYSDCFPVTLGAAEKLFHHYGRDLMYNEYSNEEKNVTIMDALMAIAILGVLYGIVHLTLLGV